MTGPILITGTSGQVGSALKSLLTASRPELAVLAPLRAELDLQNAGSIRNYVRQTRPRWIVSSAAYTAVDAAESDREAAFAANGTAPGILAEEAAAIGAGLIHLSTDYVFPGTGTRPWVETDATGPVNVYGESKLAGETAIARVAEESQNGLAYLVLRTSWVYAATGKNFVRTMLRLLSTRDTPLRVVADQSGAPTAAPDLAEAILMLMEQTEERAVDGRSLAQAMGNDSGVYHCAAAGETTWAGLARAIREHLVEAHGLNPPPVLDVPSSEYPTPAARPRNSRLDCTRLGERFGVKLPDWQVSLASVLADATKSGLAQ